MTLMQLAKDQIGTARCGVLWFAVWKDGRSWCYEEFTSAELVDDFMTADADDLEEMEWILANRDRNAILVNGYHANLGEMKTIKDFSEFIEWQYRLGSFRLSDAVESIKYSTGKE